MNVSAYLSFRKDYYNLQKRILKKLDDELKFDSSGHGEKTLLAIKLRDCKQVRGKTKLEGDEINNYLNSFSINFLGQILSKDYQIKEKIAEKQPSIKEYWINAAFDSKEVKDKTNYYIYITIMFNK